MIAYRITIEPFIVCSTSKERLKQEIQMFLEEELMVEIAPDDAPTKITIEQL